MKKTVIVIRAKEQERPIWLKDFIAGYEPIVCWVSDIRKAKTFRSESAARDYMSQIPLHREVEMERIPLEVLKP